MSKTGYFAEECVRAIHGAGDCPARLPSGNAQNGLNDSETIQKGEPPMKSRNPMIKLLAATVFAGVISAAPAYAAPATTIGAFVGCLNGLPAGSTVVNAVSCVPDNCQATVTLSPESGQPACTLGTIQLPRVIFSCPGPASTNFPALRFRPSFTLCTQPSNLVNHIEVGEDVKRDNTDDFVANIQKMADIVSPPLGPSFSVIKEFGVGTLGVDDAKAPATVNNKGCNECHDRKGTLTSGANLFGPIIPSASDGTILYTSDTDPNIASQPSSGIPLSTTCAGIPSTAKFAVAKSLCNALVSKVHP
jgi:hypothetical protein